MSQKETELGVSNERHEMLRVAADDVLGVLADELNMCRVTLGSHREIAQLQEVPYQGFTYDLKINRQQDFSTQAYLGVHLASHILLGHMRQQYLHERGREALTEYVPLPELYREYTPLQLLEHKEALDLTNELLKGKTPDEWDPKLQELLQRQGGHWELGARRFSNNLLEVMKRPAVQQTLPQIYLRYQQEKDFLERM